MTSDLILPSEIPWDEIKASDLEELLYWLFESMGAKDLEWRIGGKGSGAADQGRDLELAFFMPSPEGTLTKEIWWVEAKGRDGTVEASEVHKSVLNSAVKSNVEVFVIATNTNFSNPTRDWVKEWQREHPRPRVKLWERTELENLCSKNPLAVIRLYSKALSPQGRVEVASTKLWNYASFSNVPTLKTIWENQENIALDERALLALSASELANGNIGQRSWALLVSEKKLSASIGHSLINIPYLAHRFNENGVRQEPLIRAISYLILVAIKRIGREAVASILLNIWDNVENQEYPEEIREFILKPVLGILQDELKDVCASDCHRVSTDSVLLRDNEIKVYWKRLRKSTIVEEENEKILIIESLKESCNIGFPVSNERKCPIFNIEKPCSNISQFLCVVEKIVQARSSEDRAI